MRKALLSLIGIVCLIGMVCLTSLIIFVKPAMAGALDWSAKGYVEVTYFPVNNEYSTHGILETYLELRPKDYPRFFVFTKPVLGIGGTPPKIREIDYFTSLKTGIGYFREFSLGVGYKISKKPDIEGRLIYWNTRETSGYEGDWTGIQVRWTFGK